MNARHLECFHRAEDEKRQGTVHGIRAEDMTALESRIGADAATFARSVGFRAEPGALLLVPGSGGGLAALFGLPSRGEETVWTFGKLADALPAGNWVPDFPEDIEVALVALGFALGSYRYSLTTSEPKPFPRLLLAEPDRGALATARAICLGRDLINMPANLLGPQELAAQAQAAFTAFGAQVALTMGEELEREYPLVAHVGRGSERLPVVLSATWQGSSAGADAPLLSLVGKGVCFDSGGYDIKPSSGMLRMKKDMGGAATVIAMAHAIMEADLPLRLEVRLGCVENSVSGRAMRPLDVVRSRRGLTVEIGNTDAEGRLVLADLLAEASDRAPDLLVDVATLTGAARVALGPDLPALMSNDKGVAAILAREGERVSDPMWELPLWSGYREWLGSSVADTSNISSKPMAGAVTAGLFLEKFVAPDVRWAHIDSYAWNDGSHPGRPEGGEILTLRALQSALAELLNVTVTLK
ncbi:MAG: leucyl aminopeptidase family protein [Acetobacter sp.]|nr:leucyl aminopeptidase family protein [Acetobacter sp.]